MRKWGNQDLLGELTLGTTRACWHTYSLIFTRLLTPCTWSVSLAKPPPWRESPMLQKAARALTCSLCPQDANLSLHTDTPDLTPCFQNSLLAWVPCIYLWAALPCYLFYLRHHHQGYIVLSTLSRLKTVRGSGLSCGWGWGPGKGGWVVLF